MRRIMSALSASLLALSTFSAQPARADTVIQFVVDAAADAAPEFTTRSGCEPTLTSFCNVDFTVDLTKVAPGFFNKYVVLDARITFDPAVLLDPLCPPNLTLRTAAGDYVRRSAANNVGVQRVAVAQPQHRAYLLQIRRDGPGVATSGACVTAQSIPFTLTVKLFASKPQPVGFGFSSVHLPTSGDGEPSIAVDRLHGDATYVSAPVGVPAILGGNTGGVDFWRSFDHAATWTYSQPFFRNSTGGGDSHVVVDTAGDVFLADLAGTNSWIGRSTFPDQGANFGTLTTPAGIDADREWLATWTRSGDRGPTKVFLYYHSLNVDNLPYECVSLSGGTVWEPVCQPMVTDPVVLSNAFGNTINGNQVFDSQGTIYAVMATPVAGDPAATFRNVYLMRSGDGITFTDVLIYSAPAGNDLGALFPVIAIDSADNAYVVWSERKAPAGPSTVRISVSINSPATPTGSSWSAPVDVSPTTGGAVLPWIVAGGPGKVDVTWVGTTAAGNNDPTADWSQWMAQSTNAASGAPTFTLGRVSPQPTRYGTICLSGLGCSTSFDDGRILLDFTSIDRDSAGFANVAYANSGPEGPDGNEGRTFTDVARQAKGTAVAP